MVHCGIAPNGPRWLQTCCVFPVIALDSLGWFLFELQIVHPSKGNSRKKNPKNFLARLSREKTVRAIRHTQLNPHIMAYKSLLEINKTKGQKQQPIN